MRFYVEPSPSGGFNVRVEGTEKPVSHHDTEEEARERCRGYETGVARAADSTGELVLLRDGTRVLVRPVRGSDKPLFLAGFENFGERSRYRRFLSSKSDLATDELAFLTELDHADHEAVGAIDPVTGEGIGVARYVRVSDRPEAAETAVAVTDPWQGRGVGGVLLDRLISRAVQEGITEVEATMLTDNAGMLRLFEKLGSLEVTHRDGNVMEIEVHLPLERTALGAALRGAALATAGEDPTA
jgi:GNAT superfamily N-acetyltransferase